MAREHVGPAVVAVDGGGGAVGNEIAESHDGLGVAGRAHEQRVEEIPGGGGVGERLLRFIRGFGAAAGWADVGGGQRLGVPGHGAAVAADVEGDGQAAAGQHLVVAISDEGQRDRVADGGRSRGNDDFGPGAEGDGAIGAGQDRAAALLEADMDSVEGNRFCPESVGQADAGLLAPDVGSDDQAEGLIRGAFRRVRESEAKLGLGGGVADGVRALGGGGPGDDEVRRGRGARGGEGQGCGEDQAGQDAAGYGEH